MSSGSEEPKAGPVDLAVGVSKVFKGWIVGLAFVAVLVLVLNWGANLPDNPSFADETSTTVAGATFEDGRVAVGAQCLDVQVADTPEERAQGLKHRDNLGNYRGMVFVFDSMGTRGFTMSEVKFPLTIGFYDEAGLRVDAQDMEPCPAGSVSCPTYTSRAPFKNALEVAKGQLPEGNLVLTCPT